MGEQIKLNPEDQGNVAVTATEVFSKLENNLPRVPWLSHTGQQDAFKKTVDIAIEYIDNINADIDAKNAILFWFLSILYANNKKFRIATTSIKRVGEFVDSSVARTWIDWIGEETHQGIIIARSISHWRQR